MKEIIIHFGFGKTGTSYLQTFLANIREDLLSYKIYYPTSLIKQQDEMVKQGHVASGNLGLFFKTINSDLDTWVNDILAYVEESFTQSSASKIILSSEKVGSMGLHSFCYLKDNLESVYKVKWIGLLKDPIGLKISDIFQRIKMTPLSIFNADFDDFMVRLYRKFDNKLW